MTGEPLTGISFLFIGLIMLMSYAISPLILTPNIQSASATPNPCNPYTVCAQEHKDIEKHLNATNSALQKEDVKGALLSLNQTQMILKNHEANEYADTCGIQCKVEVNESVNQARNELQNGNTSGALLHLGAAQMALNTTEEDGNNLSQQILRKFH
jgi:hypothetical protein